MATRSQSDPPSRTTSQWSVHLFSVAGIPVRVHFTFVLFLVWIALVGHERGSYQWPLLVLGVFTCVVLHELGHALVALRMGVKTRDITLYPIGGVAMLETRPTARQELWITLAGPLVNVVIAGLLVVRLVMTEGTHGLTTLAMGNRFWDSLMLANVFLAVFNLIPAFPMDGGRILRSLLALALPESRATQIAVGIGQGLAIILGLIGILTSNLVLVLVAFFVFIGASQELASVVTRSFLSGHKVADAMQVRFRTILSGDTLETAAQMLLAGSQHDFPVVNGEEVLGVLARNDIARGLASDGPSAYVAAYMDREYRTVSPFFPLEKAVEMNGGGNVSPILVIDEGKLVGMLTGENLSEFIMLQHARAQARSA